MPEAFFDLYKLDEDKRIDLIGHMVMTHKKTVAIMVDDEPDKPERYIRKLKQKFPMITTEGPFKGPVKDVVTIKVGLLPKPENN